MPSVPPRPVWVPLSRLGIRVVGSSFASTELTSADTDGDWRGRALCAQADPEAFFPTLGDSAQPARRICAGCPVRQECLDFALAQNEEFGVWGGMSTRERQRLRRLRQKGAGAA